MSTANGLFMDPTHFFGLNLLPSHIMGLLRDKVQIFREVFRNQTTKYPAHPQRYFRLEYS